MRVGPVAETFDYFNFHWNLHKLGFKLYTPALFLLFFLGGGGGGGGGSIFFFQFLGRIWRDNTRQDSPALRKSALSKVISFKLRR